MEKFINHIQNNLHIYLSIITLIMILTIFFNKINKSKTPKDNLIELTK